MAGRNYINAVCLDGAAIFRVRHGHGCPAGNDFRQHAFALGGHVECNDEDHAAIGLHGFEELPERLDPAGQGADANNAHVLSLATYAAWGGPEPATAPLARQIALVLDQQVQGGARKFACAEEAP